MRADLGYSADCILALAQGESGEEEKAWDGAVLVACFLHLVTQTLE
jgi:hypothetical protein